MNIFIIHLSIKTYDTTCKKPVEKVSSSSYVGAKIQVIKKPMIKRLTNINLLKFKTRK